MDSSLIPDRSTNYQSPTGFSWAFLLPVAAASRGFVRVPADFDVCHFGRLLALFDALQEYLLSNLPHFKKTEVLKRKKIYFQNFNWLRMD